MFFQGAILAYVGARQHLPKRALAGLSEWQGPCRARREAFGVAGSLQPMSVFQGRRGGAYNSGLGTTRTDYYLEK